MSSQQSKKSILDPLPEQSHRKRNQIIRTYLPIPSMTMYIKYVSGDYGCVGYECQSVRVCLLFWGLKMSESK